MTQFVAQWPDGVEVRWRHLSWAEYRKFRYKLLTVPFGVTLEIYETVALQGPELIDLPAGVSRFIADYVIKNSPFSGEFAAIQEALLASRNKLRSSYLTSARALIAHVFKYTLEEVDTWDPDMFFDRLAMAEFIAGKPLDPVMPKPPEALRPKGNLWEQEKSQRSRERRQREEEEKAPRRPLSPIQNMAFERVKKARGG